MHTLKKLSVFTSILVLINIVYFMTSERIGWGACDPNISFSCGYNCCPLDWKCFGGECFPPGSTPCGNSGCPPEYPKCCQGTCWSSDSICCGNVGCPSGWSCYNSNCLPPNTDFCEYFGFYGDGICNSNCPEHDPDCPTVTTTTTIPTMVTTTVSGTTTVPDNATTTIGEEIVLQPGPEDGVDVWITSVYYDGGLDNDYLQVGGWADEYYSLIKFDISSLPENTTSAKIYLFARGRSGDESLVSMYLDQVTEAWDEKTKWADSPSYINLKTISAPTWGSWYFIDITELYNNWKNGTHINYGIQLRPTGNSNQFNTFNSSDYMDDPSLRPKLVIAGTNTTSISQSTIPTTTSTIPSSCIFTQYLDNQEDVKLIRLLRDTLHTNSSWIFLISIYYQNQSEVNTILTENLILQEKFIKIVNENMKFVRGIQSKGQVKIPASEIEAKFRDTSRIVWFGEGQRAALRGEIIGGH